MYTPALKTSSTLRDVAQESVLSRDIFFAIDLISVYNNSHIKLIICWCYASLIVIFLVNSITEKCVAISLQRAGISRCNIGKITLSKGAYNFQSGRFTSKHRSRNKLVTHHEEVYVICDINPIPNVNTFPISRSTPVNKIK